MAIIIKFLALLASITTTVFLIITGVKSSLLIVSTIFGVTKIIVLLVFCALLVYISYLLLTSKKNSSPH